MQIYESDSLAQQIIAHQQSKAWAKFILEEIGANTEVSRLLQQQSGSSHVIYKSISSYNQEQQVRNTEHIRSVSKEFIILALQHYQQQHPKKNLFINSFQTTEDPTAVTHGYIGTHINEISKIFHITIPQHLERRIYQQKIGNIGLQIIHSLLTENPINTSHIDQVYDIKNNTVEQNITKTIDCMQTDSMVCIDTSWNLCRIEDLTRSREWYQPIILFKWSFNPPHNGHLHQIKEAEKKYPNHKTLFSISINNFDPNKKVNAEEIQTRIKRINTLWYPVVLFGSWMYKDNIDLIRLKNNKEIVIPLGNDIINKIENPSWFQNIQFEVRWRKNEEFKNIWHSNVYFNNDNPYEELSSTYIRTNWGNIEWLPEQIKDDYNEYLNNQKEL
jgi:cytidyltransferase-like protein